MFCLKTISICNMLSSRMCLPFCLERLNGAGDQRWNPRMFKWIPSHVVLFRTSDLCGVDYTLYSWVYIYIVQTQNAVYQPTTTRQTDIPLTPCSNINTIPHLIDILYDWDCAVFHTQCAMLRVHDGKLVAPKI